MFKEIIARFNQGYRTMEFPSPGLKLPSRGLGLPKVKALTALAEQACPYGAISAGPGGGFDMGRCVFCGSCAKAAPESVEFTAEYKLCASAREDLVLGAADFKRAEPVAADLRRILGRSFRLRQVSAGGCAACEADCSVLQTIGWDLGRFGVQFVASPRHADGILVTGPVTKNMELALRKTYAAVPGPKVVIACGACAIAGGPYAGHEECVGIPSDIPVNLYIPGCPPHPLTILDGILRLIGRID
ncbi:MAG: hydrogenase [Elusimicrobia bacterium RIFOXYA2_FULL_58_8]|nr:MAG: hydrogenase [Elusimicrobia bacterium RIFOXYA2_FULL_58_8]OGS14407.1 MAG: hydrogenase [Elusimicrobia bacterium RIFOXYA12_FULL_57_11]